MKIDQVAIGTFGNPNDVINILKKIGCENWITDTVTARGMVFGGGPETNKAELHFNYDLGIELEVLKYFEGPNWHQRRREERVGQTFLSHIGIHVDAIPDLPFPVAQHVLTEEHTSEELNKSGKRYEYKIYDTRVFFGFDLKFIRRIEPAKDAAESSGAVAEGNKNL